jgi:hypothetical protein
VVLSTARLTVPRAQYVDTDDKHLLAAIRLDLQDRTVDPLILRRSRQLVAVLLFRRLYPAAPPPAARRTPMVIGFAKCQFCELSGVRKWIVSTIQPTVSRLA